MRSKHQRYAWTRTANGRRIRFTRYTKTLKQHSFCNQSKPCHQNIFFSSLRHSSRFVPLSFARGRIVVIYLTVRSLCSLPWTSRGGSLRRRRGCLLLLAVAHAISLLGRSVVALLLGLAVTHAISLLGRSVVALLLGLLITAVAALLLIFCQIKR